MESDNQVRECFLVIESCDAAEEQMRNAAYLEMFSLLAVFFFLFRGTAALHRINKSAAVKRSIFMRDHLFFFFIFLHCILEGEA